MKKLTKLVIGALLCASVGVASAGEPKAATPAPKAATPAPKAATPAPKAAAPAPAAKAAAPAPAASKTAPASPPATTVAPPSPPPAPQVPGAETLALAPLAGNITWAGKMMADAFMPGQPEMPTKGSASCKWTVGKLWLSCTVKNQIGAGKQVMKMEGQMIVGWDFEAKEYRGVWIDTMGASSYMKGKLDGSKFTLETLGEYLMQGQPIKWRYTWDWTDPKAATAISEGAMGKGGKWKVLETMNLKGVKAPKK